MIFLMEVLIPQVPKDSPRKKVWQKSKVQISSDIKGSTKSVTTFLKRKELVEKRLLDTTEKTTEMENTA